MCCVLMQGSEDGDCFICGLSGLLIFRHSFTGVLIDYCICYAWVRALCAILCVCVYVRELYGLTRTRNGHQKEGLVWNRGWDFVYSNGSNVVNIGGPQVTAHQHQQVFIRGRGSCYSFQKWWKWIDNILFWGRGHAAHSKGAENGLTIFCLGERSCCSFQSAGNWLTIFCWVRGPCYSFQMFWKWTENILLEGGGAIILVRNRYFSQCKFHDFKHRALVCRRAKTSTHLR